MWPCGNHRASHGHLGKSHGRVAWPCDREFLVKTRFSAKGKGRARFWFPNTQGTNPRERATWEHSWSYFGGFIRHWSSGNKLGDGD
ncbi:unnamed protein product [Linum trigynum]|uniref:Uncharacterized protein n=1 Tax=Linum trigynum TaxID=586398 RepID=A0AAV2EZY5_9ROSI